MRATVDNPEGRAAARTSTCACALKGAMRPNAILVPQRAVQQGAKGHFVWVVDKDGKAESRAGDGRRLVRRRLVHHRGPARRRAAWWSTAALALGAGRGASRPSRSAATGGGRAGDAAASAARSSGELAEPPMFSQFFIERPIFAAVISIILMLAGAGLR